MRLYWNLVTNQLCGTASGNSAANLPTGKRRSGMLIDVIPLIAGEGGISMQSANLPAGATGLTAGVKKYRTEENAYTGDYLASNTAWTGPSADHVYSGAINLNTAGINDLWTDETFTKTFDLELVYYIGGTKYPSLIIPWTLQNDLNRGGEGLPTPADPIQPPPGVLVETATGGHTGLRAILIAPLPTGEKMFHLVDVTPPEFWLVVAGTNADDDVDYIRTIDYAGGTNEKVLKRLG